jgi:transcriptional regulator of nitric oxide reductase
MPASAWSSSCARAARRAVRLLAGAVALAAASAPAGAKVFYSRSEAVALAFPDADRIEDETILLEDDQVERVQELANSELDSRIVRIYRGFRGADLLGYAFIDVHNVRTLPEAFLVVLTPSGSVASLRVLAFHEPLEYMPTERWYEQFENATLDRKLRLGRDVHGIVGATLSARATAQGVRRALALYEVVVKSR